MHRANVIPYIFLFIALFANIMFWTTSRQIKASWPNVPPVPRDETASMIALGDRQMAYRFYAIMLQNIGNEMGRQIPLKSYDYNRLTEWFFALNKLDARSNAVPMMATYYYGAVKDNKKLNILLDYLAVVGQSPEGEKWRWLGQAVSLARHELKDNDRALELAYLLAANKSPDLADWAKQMPAFILQAEGETELAYQIMLNILISNVDTLHPNEINYMQDYICNTILKEHAEISKPEFCQNIVGE